MSRILLIPLGIAFGFLSSVHAEESAMEEIIMVQENFLSSISPRPTGAELKAHPLYPELVRRVSLIERNWVHQKKGSDDAAKSDLSVVVPPNLSDVDKKHLELLQSELGLKIAPLPGDLDKDAATFYAFGFNSKQLEGATKKIGERNLQQLVTQAAVALKYKSHSSSSLLFVPWRFSEPRPITQGLSEIPHIR